MLFTYILCYCLDYIKFYYKNIINNELKCNKVLLQLTIFDEQFIIWKACTVQHACI